MGEFHDCGQQEKQGLRAEFFRQRPARLRRNGRIDRATLESMMVGMLVGDPDKASQDTRTADVLSGSGIDRTWFKDKAIGAMYEEFLDYYRQHGHLMTPENFGEWRRLEGITQDEVENWRHYEEADKIARKALHNLVLDLSGYLRQNPDAKKLETYDQIGISRETGSQYLELARQYELAGQHCKGVMAKLVEAGKLLSLNQSTALATRLVSLDDGDAAREICDACANRTPPSVISAKSLSLREKIEGHPVGRLRGGRGERVEADVRR